MGYRQSPSRPANALLNAQAEAGAGQRHLLAVPVITVQAQCLPSLHERGCLLFRRPIGVNAINSCLFYYRRLYLSGLGAIVFRIWYLEDVTQLFAVHATLSPLT